MSNTRLLSLLACAPILAVLAAGCASSSGETDPEESSEPTGYASSELRWAAPPCGASLGSFEGTVARSNGSATGTGMSCAGRGAYGLQYQCVELVMRHFETHYGLRWGGNARDLLTNAPRASVDVHSNGDHAHPPVPGDMIVWNDTAWGHVALVTSVRPGAVDILEQNVWGAGGTAVLPYDGTTVRGPAGWGWKNPAGWAHAKANGNGGGGSHDPCATAEYGGTYCGSSRQLGFGGGSAFTLYDCNNHRTVSTQSCMHGCVVAPPGTPDHCR